MQKAIYYILQSCVQIFNIALQFSAPILLIVFLIDFGFGLLSRVAPQINVFQLGFQIKPIISIFVLLTILPTMLDLFSVVIENMAENMLRTLFLLKLK